MAPEDRATRADHVAPGPDAGRRTRGGSAEVASPVISPDFDYEKFRTEALARIATEIETYEQNLPLWGEHEGRYVLIRGRDVIGFFAGEHEAIDLGYDRYGRSPFMVKQVRAIEPVFYAGNVIL